jgi:putative colanic acid biosynthesis UDP-glucose lipid carrier transferase
MLAGVGKHATNRSPPLLRALLDSFLVAGSLALISLAYGAAFDTADTAFGLVAISLLYALAVESGPRAPSLSRLLWIWALSVLAFLLLGALTGYIFHLRRDVFFTWAMLVPFLVYCGRMVLPVAALRIPEVRGYRTAVLVGLSPLGRNLGEQFDAVRRLGSRVVGLFDDRSKERLGSADVHLDGRLADLPQFVKENGVNAVFITLPNLSQARLPHALLDELRDTTASSTSCWICSMATLLRLALICSPARSE